jgi:ribosomal protein S18 acetylase RimI-like enzyme
MKRRGGLLFGYCGHTDAFEPVLCGWLVEISQPGRPVAFAVCLDDSVRIPVLADQPRPDVAAAGIGGPNCGFAVDLSGVCSNDVEYQLSLLTKDGRPLNLPNCPPRLFFGPARADVIPGRTADMHQVATLLRRNDFDAWADPGSVGLDHAEGFIAADRTGSGFIFFARIGAYLVGYSRLDIRRDEGRSRGVVALTVLEGYRRKGLGESLMRRLLQTAAQSGIPDVWLAVRPENAPALALYKKLGFLRREIGPQPWIAAAERGTSRCLPAAATPFTPAPRTCRLSASAREPR